jgi:hypothetical protein
MSASPVSPRSPLSLSTAAVSIWPAIASICRSASRVFAAFAASVAGSPDSCAMTNPTISRNFASTQGPQLPAIARTCARPARASSKASPPASITLRKADTNESRPARPACRMPLTVSWTTPLMAEPNSGNSPIRARTTANHQPMSASLSAGSRTP